MNIVLQHVQRWQNSTINSPPPTNPAPADHAHRRAEDTDAAELRGAGAAPAPPPPPDYHLRWSSSTSPPVLSPWDFAAYGYGSCTAFATLHVSSLAPRVEGPFPHRVAPHSPHKPDHTAWSQLSSEQVVYAPSRDYAADLYMHTHSLISAWCWRQAYAARAIGIPARVAGAPCWNNGDFAGLASNNSKVIQCWQ